MRYLALFLVGLFLAVPAIAATPNVIVILTDDQGYGDFSFTGNPVLRTPNIDALAAQSARFTDFNVSPTCSPSRCALLTGRHEFRSGVTHTINERERMSLKAVTLPQVLKSAGYATGIFGKWHLGDEDAYQPDRRGFDEVFIHGTGGIGQSYPGSAGDAPGNTYFNPAIKHNGRFEKTNGYCTDVFFAQATKWIESRKGADKPFFAWIATNAPHAPLQVRPEDEARYAGKVKPMVAKFFGMIANIDDNVGRLMAKLKELGLEENTVVVFMTDNGGTVGCNLYNAGMRGEKTTPYLGGIRVPFLVRWPGVVAPGDRTQLAMHVDLVPTLAEIAGAAPPAEIRTKWEGRSLMPLLKEANAKWDDRLFFAHIGRWPKGKAVESKYSGCSVRDSRYQLVSAAKDNKKAWQLFDLKTDLAEKTDVAAAHPEIVKRLETAYDQWWERSLPDLDNEDAVGPKVNPFKEQYRKQFPEAATDK
jgi:arylsulfatase